MSLLRSSFALQPPRDHSGLRYGTAFYLVLLVAYFCFLPAASGPFLFDDFPNLENLAVLGGDLSWSSLGEYLAAWQGTPGRPLSALTFLIEDSDWPSDPYSFKRNNILWHLLTAVLIFGLCRRLSEISGTTQTAATRIALVVASVWVVHPIHLSTTMLVVQRMTILSQALIVIGLWAYLSFLARPDKTLANAIKASAMLLAFAAISYLAKENGPLIFAYAAAINLTLARPILARYALLPRAIVWLCSLGLTLCLLAGLVWMVRDPAASYASRDFTLWERLLTQPRVLLDYLQAIFIPDIKGTIYHDDFPVSKSIIDPFSTLWSLLLLVGAVTLALVLRAKYSLLAFGILWYLAGHLIESTVIQLEIYFEHRNYLAMVGPIFAVAMAAAQAPRINGPIKTFAAVASTILLSGMLLAASKTWGDPLDLAVVWAEEKPNSVRAQQLVASELVKIGMFDDAEAVLERAVERIPHASEFQFQKALLRCIAGNSTRQDFARLSELAPQANWARVIPDIVQALRRRLEGDACGGSLSHDRLSTIILALSENEGFARSKSTKGYLFNELALVKLDQGNLNEGLYYLEKSHAARPTVQQALNRARVALEIRNFAAASDAISDAQAISSGLKSWLRQDAGRIEREIALYNAVVQRQLLEFDQSSQPSTQEYN